MQSLIIAKMGSKWWISIRLVKHVLLAFTGYCISGFYWFQPIAAGYLQINNFCFMCVLTFVNATFVSMFAYCCSFHDQLCTTCVQFGCMKNCWIFLVRTSIEKIFKYLWVHACNPCSEFLVWPKLVHIDIGHDKLIVTTVHFFRWWRCYGCFKEVVLDDVDYANY